MSENQRISINYNKSLSIIDLGLIPFNEAWKIQTDIHEELIGLKKADPEGKSFKNHSLILCEHPHVFTLGKSGKEDHLIQPKDKMSEIEAEYLKINRGGDITYHGPGQLVAYPILDLDKLFNDVHKYVRLLEQTVIDVLGEYKISGERIPGLTGVWLDTDSAHPRKICAIGVHLSRWVSLHGLAFNINTNLDYFKYIIPCGINQLDKGVTSLSIELQQTVDMNTVKDHFIRHFLRNFELTINT